MKGLILWLRSGRGRRADHMHAANICQLCGAFVYAAHWDDHAIDHRKVTDLERVVSALLTEGRDRA